MSIGWLILILIAAFIVYILLKSRGHISSQVGRLRGPGEYRLPVVGESHYQRTLKKICGGRTQEGVEKYVDATLVLEDSNPYSNTAVRVDIQGEPVGHLSGDDARSYRKRLEEAGHPRLEGVCSAVIRGGWDRGGGDVGYFGVFLDLPIDDSEVQDSKKPEKTVEKDSYNSTVLTFDVDNPNRKELPECVVNDYVNLWKPSMNPKRISIFRSGTGGGMGKIGFVPNKYFDVISSHMDEKLRIDANIIELTNDRCKIRCKLVSRQELEAEKAKEIRSHTEELEKPYSPRKPIVFIFDAKENHGLQIGEKLKFHFEKPDFYRNNPHQWRIQLLDSKEQLVGTKSDEISKVLERILKAHFNSYDFDIKVLSAGKGYTGYEWYKFPVKLEAKPFKKRIPCSDGNCIGVINEKGVCTICGKKSEGAAKSTEETEKDGREQAKPLIPVEERVLEAERGEGKVEKRTEAGSQIKGKPSTKFSSREEYEKWKAERLKEIDTKDK